MSHFGMLARRITTLSHWLIPIILCWAAYCVVVNAAAAAFALDPSQKDSPGTLNLRNGFIDHTAEVDNLFRWDAVWYLAMARDGYNGPYQNSKYVAGFFPLYPIAIRTVSDITGISLEAAGFWIARLALLMTMILVFKYAVVIHARPDWGLAAAFALVCHPMSFIFISYYAESLFIMLVVATFLSFRLEYFVWAMLAALAATLTRPQGFMLVPALAVAALIHLWPQRRRLSMFLPLLGALLGIAIFLLINHLASGDAFYYWKAKEFFGLKSLSLSRSLDISILAREVNWRLEQLSTHGVTKFASLIAFLEIVLYLLTGCVVGWLAWRRRFAEAIFCLGCMSLVVLSGMFWGYPRFSLSVLPLALVYLPPTRKTAIGMAVVVICSIVLQTAMIAQYVHHFPPAP